MYFHYFHKDCLTQAHEHLYGTWFCSCQALLLHLDRGHKGGLPRSAGVSRLVRGSSGVAFHSCFIHLLITFCQILWGWNLLSGTGPCMPKGKFFWRVSARAIKPFLSQWKKKFFIWIGWLQFTSNSKCNLVTQEMFSLCLFLAHTHMHTLTPNTHSHTHTPLTHPAHTHTKYTLTPHSCTPTTHSPTMTHSHIHSHRGLHSQSGWYKPWIKGSFFPGERLSVGGFMCATGMEGRLRRDKLLRPRWFLSINKCTYMPLLQNQK